MWSGRKRGLRRPVLCTPQARFVHSEALRSWLSQSFSEGSHVTPTPTHTLFEAPSATVALLMKNGLRNEAPIVSSHAQNAHQEAHSQTRALHFVPFLCADVSIRVEVGGRAFGRARPLVGAKRAVSANHSLDNAVAYIATCLALGGERRSLPPLQDTS